MKKKIISLILVFSMILTCAFYLVACDNGEKETESVTEESASETDNATESEKETQTDKETDASSTETTESRTEAPTETESPTESESATVTEAPSETETVTETQTQTEAPTESETEKVVYENGGTVQGAGITWPPNSFALTENTIDESGAIEIKAEDLVAKLQTRENGIKSTDVYKVIGQLTLSSDTKYYGHLASFIVEDGMVIDSVGEVVVKEMIVKGDLTIKNAKSVTFFRLEVKGGEIAINIDEKSSDIAFKSCKVSASDTAVKTDADKVTFFESYVSANKGIVSTGDDLSIHSTEIVAVERAILSSGKSPIIRNNEITLASDGIGVELTKGSYNALVAYNIIKDAQISVKVTEAFNAVVLLNSAITVAGENNTNLYVVENKLGGAIELTNNEYLLCDGNSFIKDNKVHPIVNTNNTEINGDNLHDVNAREQYGAKEELLPHTNKDLFVGMERLNKVRDASLIKTYNINKYISNMAQDYSAVIIPPGAYISPSLLNLGSVHSNTTVYAYGVYHEAENLGGTIKISNASSFTFKGLTVGFATQSAGQVHILEKLSQNRVLVVPAAGFDKEFGKTDLSVYSIATYGFWAGQMNCWKGLGSDYEVVQRNEDGTMVLQLTGTDAGKIFTTTGIGDVWACRMAGNNSLSIHIYNCSDFLMKDCVVYSYAASLAICATTAGGEMRLERVHNTAHSSYIISEEEYKYYEELEEKYGVDLEIYVDELGRYRGSIPRLGSCDATHVVGTSKGLSATSCIFDSSCDDGSNQRSNSSRLHKVIKNNDGTTTLVYKNLISETPHGANTTAGLTVASGTETEFFRQGDRIFAYASNGKILCDTEVLADASTFPGGSSYHMMTYTYPYNGTTQQIIYTCTLRQVTVPSSSIEWVLDENGNETDRAAVLVGYDLDDNNYPMTNKVIVDNVSRNSAGFTFDNVLFKNINSRGVLVKTRDATITHCTFKNILSTAILLSVECTWGESTVPQNITVEGCLFDNTGSTYKSENNLTLSPIAIQGLGELSNSVEISESTLPCKNVRIIGNKFVNNGNMYCITASAAQGITIKDNVFSSHPDDTAKKYRKAININGCMNIDVSGNIYSDFVDGDVEKSIVARNYKGLTGSDVEGILADSHVPETEQ